MDAFKYLESDSISGMLPGMIVLAICVYRDTVDYA